MHDIDLTAKVNKIIRFALPSLLIVAAIIGYAEFRYWHRSEVVHLDNAKVAGTMVSVRVLTTGKVKELLFDDGAQVQAGDVIARLEVDITDEEIKQLENTVQLAKDQYARLQEGQWVKVAVQRERVTYKQVQTSPGGGGGSGNLAKLEERANRMAELFEMGAVSAVQRDAARRAYESALSESSSPQYSSEPTVEYYTEYVDEFRPTPPEVLAGAEQAIKQAELSLNVARQEARETEVIAPVSGAIYYSTETEAALTAGDSVARIGDNRELWVEAEVTEDIFNKIPLGKLATVTIDGKKLFGTVMEKIKPNVAQAADEDSDAEEPLELPEIPDATNQPAPQAQSPPEEKPTVAETQNETSTPAQPTDAQPATQPETPSTESQPTPPKLPEIPAAETQAKPNDKFIIKISLPVERDFDCKPGTVAVAEIKI